VVSSSSVQERSWSIITVLLLSPKETLQPLLRSISVAATFDFQSSIVKDFDWKK